MRHLLPLLLLPLLAVAAPVPKTLPTPKVEDVFGEVSEGKGECKLEMKKGGALAVTVPNSHPQREPNTAAVMPPLVGKTVEGDFILTVRVSVEMPGADVATGAKGVPSGLGGVAVVPAEGVGNTGVTVGTVRRLKAGEWTASNFLCHREPRQSSASEGGAGKKADAVWYRVTRRGAELKVETSGDGTKWAAFTTHKVNTLPTAVKVGPTAFHTTGQDVTVTFDEYKIEMLKDEEKK